MPAPSSFFRFLEKTVLATLQAIRESSLSIKRGEIQARGFAVILISVVLVLKGDVVIDTIRNEKLSIPESAKSEIRNAQNEKLDMIKDGTTSQLSELLPWLCAEEDPVGVVDRPQFGL